jgi:hypothetical protein
VSGAWSLRGGRAERIWRAAILTNVCDGGVSGARLARVWRIFGFAFVWFCGVCMLVDHASGTCLARVWPASGACLLRVYGVCMARVWRVSGSCLVRVWLSVCCVSGACMALVWSVYGAWRLRGGRVERTWCVASVKRYKAAMHVPSV